MEHTKASVVALLMLAMGVSTILPTIIQNIYLAYLCDAVFNIIVSSCITITTFKIAHSLTTNLYGFIVGVNACIAGTLDLFVTFVVIDDHMLGCPPIQQYRVYTGFAVVSVLLYFFYKAVVLYIQRREEIPDVFRSPVGSFAGDDNFDVMGEGQTDEQLSGLVT